ncbi:MAG: DUF3301 domain-containing protein [Pseudomonadota bacterium]
MESALLGIIVIGAVGWFWQNSLRASEAACVACRRLCEAYGYQFLDDTIALNRIRLARSTRGHATFARLYGFEFSLNGADRYRGTVAMLGNQVQTVQLPPEVRDAPTAPRFH